MRILFVCAGRAVLEQPLRIQRCPREASSSVANPEGFPPVKSDGTPRGPGAAPDLPMLDQEEG